MSPRVVCATALVIAAIVGAAAKVSTPVASVSAGKEEKCFKVGGMMRWSFDAGAEVGGGGVVSLDGSTLFVGSDDGVYALSAADGSKKWLFETERGGVGAPTLSSDGSTVFVGSYDHSVYALSTADGSKSGALRRGIGGEFPHAVVGRLDVVCRIKRYERVCAEHGGRVEEVELRDAGRGGEFPRCRRTGRRCLLVLGRLTTASTRCARRTGRKVEL